MDRIKFLIVFFVTPFALLFAQGVTDEAHPPAETAEPWKPAPPTVMVPANGAPSDAIVLFDGKNLDAWESVNGGPSTWSIADGAMVIVPQAKPVDQQTKLSFNDVQLHLEFRTPADVEKAGQDRGNSGIYFMGLYELQILDSWQNETYANGQLGAIYRQHAPLVNPGRRPGEWQTYDVIFIAPRFARDGTLFSPARMTVFLNGVLVQYDTQLRGPTVAKGQAKYQIHAPRLPLLLQDHGSPVAFRNIWIRDIKLP